MFHPFGFISFLRVLTNNVLMREKPFKGARTLKIDSSGETFTSPTQQPRRTSVPIKHIPAKVFEYLSYCRYRFWCTYPNMSGSGREKFNSFPTCCLVANLFEIAFFPLIKNHRCISHAIYLTI